MKFNKNVGIDLKEQIKDYVKTVLGDDKWFMSKHPCKNNNNKNILTKLSYMAIRKS